MPPGTPNDTWPDVARNTREALRWLGHGITPRCLPDEPEPCGGSFELHAMAHLATIKAICDHQLAHLGACAEVDEIYRHTLAELADGY
jgi:hypothetical protein